MSSMIRKMNRELKELQKRRMLCRQYRQQVADYLKDLNGQKKLGRISKEEYLEALDAGFGKGNPIDWIDYYDNEIKKTTARILDFKAQKIEAESANAAPGINKNAKILAAVFIIMLMAGIGISMLKPDITGFVVNIGSRKISANYTDGYDVGGAKWAEIKGRRLYERCLKVKSDIYFDAVLISAKITDAADEKDLALGIYASAEKDEPEIELGSCTVTDYSDIWKSCSIEYSKGIPANYWICAYSPSEENSTHYTIAYKNGGRKKTALWTGSYWQKLERSSYTIKADFIKWTG